jgi:hypothetical protein
MHAPQRRILLVLAEAVVLDGKVVHDVATEHGGPRRLWDGLLDDFEHPRQVVAEPIEERVELLRHVGGIV